MVSGWSLLQGHQQQVTELQTQGSCITHTLLGSFDQQDRDVQNKFIILISLFVLFFKIVIVKIIN